MAKQCGHCTCSTTGEPVVHADCFYSLEAKYEILEKQIEMLEDRLDTELGPCPTGHTLDRIDNDGNYEPGNVRWATAERQYRNSLRTRQPQGERSGRSKLTESDAREILGLHKSGISQKSLADRYSVSVPTINMLVNRKTWKHLSEEALCDV